LNISFAMTTDELLAGLKLCTRRRWKPVTAKQFKKGSLHYAWSKDTRVKGALKVAVIRATADAYQEPLGEMPESDLEAEGGMCATREEFIRLVDGKPEEELWVARFEIVEYLVGEDLILEAKRRVAERRRALAA
jgi:hypothetical protein